MRRSYMFTTKWQMKRPMHILTSSATVIITLFATGCAGRPPQPVALVQPSDHYMDCTAISIEAQANNAKLQSLGSEEGSKVAQNVVAGVAGLFIWPLWFAMDFQDASGKEVASVNSRNQYLTAMAMQRNCGAPAPQVAQYPVQSQLAASPVQSQPVAVGTVYSRPPVLYTTSTIR